MGFIFATNFILAKHSTGDVAKERCVFFVKFHNFFTIKKKKICVGKFKEQAKKLNHVLRS